MDFIAGFFIGSTFWFWAFILIEMGVLFYCIQSERFFLSIASVVLTVILFQILLGISVIGYLFANPVMIPIWLIGYPSIGAAYALFRWDRKGAKWRRRYDRGDENEKKESWGYKPVAKKNIGRITSWIAYWPFSATWWFLSDYIIDMFWNLTYRLLGVFDKITARHMHGLEDPKK